MVEQPKIAPILEVHGISKKFGAVQALCDVDFEVYSGEVVGLVGDNGAGKSTLVKIISGVHPPDTGTFIFEGREVAINRPRDSVDLGIETVYQDLALCDNLDVVANLYIGRELSKTSIPGLKGLNQLDENSMEKRAIEPPGRAACADTICEEHNRLHVWRPAPIRGGRPVSDVELQSCHLG